MTEATKNTITAALAAASRAVIAASLMRGFL
jgi:hypothetical protein